MIASLRRMWRVARTELTASLRNRRAVVVTLLFIAVAAMTMYGTISAFAVMEREVLSGLKLPVSDNPCSVTTALWKSQPFMRIIGRIVGDSLVFADIKGRHPLLLAYALLLFNIVPFLTLMVSAPRIADDLRSGAVRYWLVRVTRTEWSLGKFVGEAMTVGFAMLAGAVAAWAVVVWRLPAWDGVHLFGGVLDWTARAWVYAFGWLGLFMGLSHIVKSGVKAIALCTLAMLGAAAWSPMLSNFSEYLPWLDHLDVLVPQSASSQLWRRSFPVLFQGVAQLVSLSFVYLLLGVAVFSRRDA